jgi:DNA-directed RNA polymerase subunit RPC12/RpoP
MDEVLNYAASFPLLDELGVDNEGLQQGRLTLNTRDGEYVFGKGSLFSTEIKESQRLVWGNIHAVEHVERLEHGSLLSKRHGIAIHLPKPLKVGGELRESLVFWMSKSDTEAFVAAQKKMAANRQAIQELLATIERELKSRGKMSLKEIAEDHIDLLSSAVGEPLDSRKAIIAMQTYVECLIAENRLSGVIDPEKMEYVDRDFIVRQQRIINVQLDFNSLMLQLGKKGVSLTSIQCTQCGSPCKIPETGTMFKCEACGATIMVTDVFETFKAFLE